MEKLLAERYARVRLMTLDPEDGDGLGAYDESGELVFHFPLDPGNVAGPPRLLRRDGWRRS